MSDYVVLVAFDGTDPARLALARGALLAQAHGTTTLHVVHADGGYDPHGRIEYAAERHKLALKEKRAEWTADIAGLEEVRGMSLKPHWLVGPPAKEIVRIAGSVAANIIVIGTRGRKGVSRWVLGSVAEEVLRLSTCSVLVVREKNWSASAA